MDDMKRLSLVSTCRMSSNLDNPTKPRDTVLCISRSDLPHIQMHPEHSKTESYLHQWFFQWVPSSTSSMPRTLGRLTSLQDTQTSDLVTAPSIITIVFGVTATILSFANILTAWRLHKLQQRYHEQPRHERHELT